MPRSIWPRQRWPQRAWPRQLGPGGRRAFDIVLVGALLLAMAPTSIGREALLLSLAQITPLLWRRGHPLWTFAAVAALSGLQVLVLDVPIWGQVAFPIAVYSAARFAGGVAAAFALSTGFVGAAVATFDWTSEPYGPGDLRTVILAVAAPVVAAWALGTQARVRGAYVDALVERAERTERESAQQLALAASDERARIAREMHDVVAHSLSVVVVQADGARYAAGRDPAVAAATLERIAATGRSALADMRQLLGLLRSDETGTRSLPRLGDLPALIEESDAEADLVGLDRAVPDAVALTTYRVVQEALTNVRKHAGPGTVASVRLTVGEQDLVVTITDDGRGAGVDPSPKGHGLLGMRERVLLHEGTLDAGPRAGGGFEVTARLCFTGVTR